MVTRHKKEEKSTKKTPFIIALIVAIIGVGGILPFIVFIINSTSQNNPCKVYLEEIRSEINLTYQSAEAPFYHSSIQKNTIELSNVDSSFSKEKFFKNMQLSNFYKAFEDLKTKFILPVNDSLLLTHLKEANGKGKIFTDKYTTGRLLTVKEYPIENIKFEVPEVCKFEYKVELLTPKRSENVFPKKVFQTINQALNLCDEFQKTLENPLNNTINIKEIFKCLEENPEFLKSLDELIIQYSEFFKIVDTGLGWMQKNNNVYFKRGEYDINGLYGIIFDKLLKEYEKYIRSNPGQYNITCIGFSDPSRIISENGISYSSNGHYDIYLNPILYENESSSGGEKIESRIKGNKSGNIKLSYARAYSGIQYIKNNFDPILIKDNRVKIQFQYKGGGIDHSSSANKYKRRIEVRLVKINKD